MIKTGNDTDRRQLALLLLNLSLFIITQASKYNCVSDYTWHISEYLMLIDLDEVIVPHGSGNSTIKQMLEFVASGQATTKTGQALKLPPTISSFSFQNAFFYLQFPDDEESRLDQLLRLRVMSKTRRRTKFNPQKQRSKYICVPRNVNEAGNHFIWEYR